jgi:hypothetical protein
MYILNRLFYSMMVIGFFGCSIQATTVKMKVVGLLLTAVNALLFL